MNWRNVKKALINKCYKCNKLLYVTAFILAILFDVTFNYLRLVLTRFFFKFAFVLFLISFTKHNKRTYLKQIKHSII